ncbi:MAG TPA: SDR family oxidoreductase [Ramlibacter sp.]|nr:SDR family oxidoreductase [Ramlibacter sp.]
MNELEGHVAFVTGAGRGIGQEVASLLARRGATVGVADLDAVGVDQTLARVKGEGGRAHGFVLDAGDRDAVLEAVANLRRQCGRLDSVVASAMWIRYESIEEVRAPTLARMLNVGLEAVFWAAQAALQQMDGERGGSIVTFASPVADRGHRGTSGYTAVKGGVEALTRQMAIELAPRGIRVNAVTPGATPTPGAHVVVDEAGWELRRRATPLGRLGAAADIAEAVAFLVSSRASFITGENLHVDGGLTAGAF